MKKTITSITIALCTSALVSVAGIADNNAKYDQIITNALVYDGSGDKPYQADIAIVGERIAKIGDLDEKNAQRVTDAGGLAVTPGFINMLSWAPMSLQIDGRGMSDVLQGVTLEVFGEGMTLGPSNEKSIQLLEDMIGDVEAKPEWATFGGFMQSLADGGITPNVASYVGATTVRAYVMGYKTDNPSDAEMTAMKELVKDAMEEGAIGLGSSLIYVPAQYATTEELTELMKVVGSYGGSYISHIRSESNNLIPAANEILEIARNSGAPAEFYHLKSEGPDNWGKLDELLEIIEKARADGLEIWADMYPYPAASTGLDSTLPPWVLEGGVKDMIDRLANPAVRAQAKKEMNIASEEWDNGFKWASPDGMLLVEFFNDDMESYIGKTVGDVMRERGIDAEDAIMDLLVENGEGRIDVVYFSMSEENIRKKIKKPWITFGSDGFTHTAEGETLKISTHPRDYGTFARVLGKYVRDEKLITLPEAIHRLTALPAERLRIKERGLLKEGYYADIVIFDPETIQDHATFEKPHQYSTGVHHVWVNGSQAVMNGKHTGNKAGKFVRGPGWKGQ